MGHIAGSYASLADTVELLDQPMPARFYCRLRAAAAARIDALRRCALPLHADGPWVLDGFDLTIRKGQRVGFVGATGAGKSTALDLLMGLLSPSEGRLLVTSSRSAARACAPGSEPSPCAAEHLSFRQFIG